MTKTVKIGNRIIGGGNPILIQSMTNTKTENVEATAAQINQLTAAGCDIIRCAVPTMDAAKALKEIKNRCRFRSLQTFILTIVLQLQQWRMEQTKSASTRQYRKRGACKGSGGCRKRAQHSNPCRGKQWFLRKKSGGEIPWSDG